MFKRIGGGLGRGARWLGMAIAVLLGVSVIVASVAWDTSSVMILVLVVLVLVLQFVQARRILARVDELEWMLMYEHAETQRLLQDVDEMLCLVSTLEADDLDSTT